MRWQALPHFTLRDQPIDAKPHCDVMIIGAQRPQSGCQWFWHHCAVLLSDSCTPHLEFENDVICMYVGCVRSRNPKLLFTHLAALALNTMIRSHGTLIRCQVICCHDGVCYHDVAALESCRPVLVRARAETGVTYTLVYGPCQTRFGYVSGNRHT